MGWKTGPGKEARSSLVPGDQDWTGQDGTDGGRGREDVDGQYWVGVSGGARCEGRGAPVFGGGVVKKRGGKSGEEIFFQDETSSRRNSSRKNTSIKKHNAAVEHQARTRILVGTPSKTLPLSCPVLPCPCPPDWPWTPGSLLVTAPHSALGPWCSERLYHRDPEWVVGGSRGGLQWLHCAHASPNALLGPTRAHRPFAGPNVASAVGRRAVQLLGWLSACWELGRGTGE
ncbi:hypothetical protein L207DRAFT_530880 [Hyaloscypha variabilis F]|uniref:Uncharacterized protein n=1 Tax=Hyaloscypha variabilis (strain UAMH 11265 / GT02V1 / F) TaxID=1149755 RepID=A0A2J6RHD8_HYAVF|nr:hypothetical protein L207DRAFT_530880 [Hyaloscypha variabilis F]